MYKDFDSFFEETKEQEELKIKLYGKEYIIPNDVSALATLKVMRMRKQGKTETTEAESFELALEMLGKENVEEWMEKGIKMKQLEAIMEWANAEKIKEAGLATMRKKVSRGKKK